MNCGGYNMNKNKFKNYVLFYEILFLGEYRITFKEFNSQPDIVNFILKKDIKNYRVYKKL